MQEDRKRQSYGFTMGGHRLRLPNASNNIIQKGLAFGREQSGTVTVPGARRALGILPRRLHGRGGAAVVAAMTPHQRKWRIPMSKLTDTQLVILSSASRRNDRGVDLPTNVTGEALRKAVEKLIRAGLLEEVRAHGSLLGWRRDAEAGPMALRITQQGLEAVGVTEDTVNASTETPIGAAAAPQVETSAAEAVSSRKRMSAVVQKPARKKQQLRTAKTT